jgi:hypothetical protein
MLCHFAGCHAISIACRVLSAALLLAGMTDIPTIARDRAKIISLMASR